MNMIVVKLGLQNSFIKSIKKPVRAQNYKHLHFTLTMRRDTKKCQECDILS